MDRKEHGILMEYTEDMFEPVGTMPVVGDRIEGMGMFENLSGAIIGIEAGFRTHYKADFGFTINEQWFEVEGGFRILKRQPTHDGTVGLQDGDEEEGGLSLVDEPESNLQLYRKIGTMWGAILHDWAKLAAQCDGPVPVPVDLVAHCTAANLLAFDVDDRFDEHIEMAKDVLDDMLAMREEAGKGML